MTRSFSLYPPAGALVVLAVGVGLAASVALALIVAGSIALAGWVAYFAYHTRGNS